MFDSRMRLLVGAAAGVLALSGCTSAGGKAAPVRTQNATVTSSETARPIPKASTRPGATDAFGDIKVGAIRVDAKLRTPSAEIMITNHSSKRSNYIVDLNIMSADGKTKLDATMVSVQSLQPGKTAKRVAQFMTTLKLPTGARITIEGIARLVT